MKSLWPVSRPGCDALQCTEPSGCTRHAHAPTPSSCRRWPPIPLDRTNTCLPYTERSYGNGAMADARKCDREGGRTCCSRQPWPDGLLEACKREDSVGLLSPPSSQLSCRASLLGSHNGSATFLTRISPCARRQWRGGGTFII